MTYIHEHCAKSLPMMIEQIPFRSTKTLAYSLTETRLLVDIASLQDYHCPS